MDGSPTARLEWDDYKELAPDANTALLSLSHVAANHGLDKGLLELVKLRVSQMNACSFCVAWHVNAASRLGVAAAKLHTVATWRGAQGFDAPRAGCTRLGGGFDSDRRRRARRRLRGRAFDFLRSRTRSTHIRRHVGQRLEQARCCLSFHATGDCEFCGDVMIPANAYARTPPLWLVASLVAAATFLPVVKPQIQAGTGLPGFCAAHPAMGS